MTDKYMKATEALQLAAEREREANKWYRQAADMTEDPDGKRTFKWLAKEELRHLAKVRKQLKSLEADQGWLEWRSVITPVDRSEFPAMSEAQGAFKEGAGERDALRQAIETEKASIAFYKGAEDSTPDQHGKAMFKALAGEEEGHLALLEEELEWIIKSRKYFTLHRFALRSD